MMQLLKKKISINFKNLETLLRVKYYIGIHGN